MCVGIIRNNSLVGGRARAEVRTPATERVTLYCTWHHALTTGPHGQVYVDDPSANSVENTAG